MADEIPFDPHAEAVGKLCNMWAALENWVDMLLAVKIPLPESDVESAVLGSIDFRAKLEIVKHVGFLKKPNDKWFDVLERSIGRIDNELRPARNRFVHDGRLPNIESGVMERYNRSPKLVKPQAFKRAFRRHEVSPVTVEEIDDLTFLVFTGMLVFIDLWEKRDQPNASPHKLAQQFARLKAPDVQRPRERKPKAPTPPPQSSEG